MDIRQADLGLLLALDALLEEGSVTGAARRIGISQPAFSAQLARLRTLFGDPLMVPSGRKLVPTSRAKDLKAPLHTLLGELTTLVRQGAGFDATSATTTFRLSGTDYVHLAYTTAVACRVRRAAPLTRFAMMPFNAQTAWRDLEEDRIDAIVATTLFPLNEARATRLFSEDFVFIQRAGHPRGTGALTLPEFCALDHVLVSPEGGGFTGATDHTLARLGVRRSVSSSVPSFLLAPALVAASDQVCVIPRRVAAADRGPIDAFELPFELDGFDVQLLWHSRRQDDPAHRFLRACATQGGSLN